MVNMEDFSRKDLEAADSSRVLQLSAENEALRSHVQTLEKATPPQGETDGPSRQSLEQENAEMLAEIHRLKDLSQSAAKVPLPV